MTCDACARAAEYPATGLYMVGCMSCEARALANGPEAHARAADPSALQGAMRAMWPDADQYKRGRVMVWDWISKLAGTNEEPA